MSDSEHSQQGEHSLHARTLEQRRGTRSRYHTLLNELHDHRSELTQPGADLGSILKKTNTLLDQVDHPRELGLDAELQRSVVQILSQQVSNMHVKGAETRPADLAKAFRTVFCPPTTAPSESQADQSEAEPAPATAVEPPPYRAWAACGEMFRHLLRAAPRLNLMLPVMLAETDDAESAEPKAKKPRKEKQQLSEEVRPERLERPEEHQAECTEQMNRSLLEYVRGRITRDGALSFVDLCVDRTSFGRTVETLFSLSFLVKAGKIGIDASVPDNVTVFLPDSDSATQSQVSQVPVAGHSSSAIIHINHAIWQHWCTLGGRDGPIPLVAAEDGAQRVASRTHVLDPSSAPSQPETPAAPPPPTRSRRTVPPSRRVVVKAEREDSEEEEIIADPESRPRPSRRKQHQ